MCVVCEMCECQCAYDTVGVRELLCGVSQFFLSTFPLFPGIELRSSRVLNSKRFPHVSQLVSLSSPSTTIPNVKSESMNIKYVPVEHERKKVWIRASCASQDGSQCVLLLPGPSPQCCTGLWAKTTGQFKTLSTAQNYFLQVDGEGQSQV